MNIQIKRMLLDTGLFEEEEGYNGIFFAQKLDYDSTKEIEDFIKNVTEEIHRSIENWRDADTESKETDYFRGYNDACDDILQELKERFR